MLQLVSDNAKECYAALTLAHFVSSHISKESYLALPGSLSSWGSRVFNNRPSTWIRVRGNSSSCDTGGLNIAGIGPVIDLVT